MTWWITVLQLQLHQGIKISGGLTLAGIVWGYSPVFFRQDIYNNWQLTPCDLSYRVEWHVRDVRGHYEKVGVPLHFIML